MNVNVSEYAPRLGRSSAQLANEQVRSENVTFRERTGAG